MSTRWKYSGSYLQRDPTAFPHVTKSSAEIVGLIAEKVVLKVSVTPPEAFSETITILLESATKISSFQLIRPARPSKNQAVYQIAPVVLDVDVVKTCKSETPPTSKTETLESKAEIEEVFD